MEKRLTNVCSRTLLLIASKTFTRNNSTRWCGTRPRKRRRGYGDRAKTKWSLPCVMTRLYCGSIFWVLRIFTRLLMTILVLPFGHRVSSPFPRRFRRAEKLICTIVPNSQFFRFAGNRLPKSRCASSVGLVILTRIILPPPSVNECCTIRRRPFQTLVNSNVTRSAM